VRWRAAAALLIAVVVAPLAGALVPRPLVPPAMGETPATRRVLVLSNPIHTDIALPADPDVLARFGFLEASGLPLDDERVRWVVLGWGGRSFYLETPTWSDLKAGPVFRALTVDTSVMHVAVGGSIDPAGEGVTAIDLDDLRFAKLVEAAAGSFARSGGGEPILVAGLSYGDYDRFYEAEGRFNALLGCNTWTGAVLRQAGLRTGWWNPLPQSLVWSLRAFNDLP
jgi:uncharacterized protein (TIGR02117 family)